MKQPFRSLLASSWLRPARSPIARDTGLDPHRGWKSNINVPNVECGSVPNSRQKLAMPRRLCRLWHNLWFWPMGSFGVFWAIIQSSALLGPALMFKCSLCFSQQKPVWNDPQICCSQSPFPSALRSRGYFEDSCLAFSCESCACHAVKIGKFVGRAYTAVAIRIRNVPKKVYKLDNFQ